MRFNQLGRREFIALTAGAVTWPSAFQPHSALARAKRPLVGVLFVGRESPSIMRSATVLAFRNGLRENGYMEGLDIDLAYRFADGFLDRLQMQAQELIRLKPDAVLAPVSRVALAMRAASARVPIVCPLLENPVWLGLVASENRPAGNVTGLLRYVDGLAGKHAELARELIPGMVKVGLLVNPDNPDATPRRDVEAAASALSINIVPVEASRPYDLDAAFQKLASAQVPAVIVIHDTIFFIERHRILTLAAAARLPTVWSDRQFAEEGGVLSYGINEADSFRRAAGYVVKILGGARPGDLPVELPVKFELVINLKTARALALDVPPTLLARADEVIE
jgi:putative tryptophan/tyrosine transport system substrate-binding protein